MWDKGYVVGTAEQWIREGKYALKWTRLSCHRFDANHVRLQLFALAYNSWPTDPANAMPIGVTFDPAGPYKLAPSVRFGVYQALSTRNGGEVISASDY